MANSATDTTSELLSDKCETLQPQTDLEAQRHRMVQTVLQIRARCESADSSPMTGNAALAQELLSAAVRDLEELDERLHEARNGYHGKQRSGR